MAALYAEGRIEKLFESGKRAADYVMKKVYDIHMRDAALKCVLEANAILSKHDDANVIKTDLAVPEDEQAAAKLLDDKIAELQAMCPKGDGEEEIDTTNLSPAMLLLLMQIGKVAFSFLRRWF